MKTDGKGYERTLLRDNGIFLVWVRQLSKQIINNEALFHQALLSSLELSIGL